MRPQDGCIHRHLSRMINGVLSEARCKQNIQAMSELVQDSRRVQVDSHSIYGLEEANGPSAPSRIIHAPTTHLFVRLEELIPAAAVRGILSNSLATVLAGAGGDVHIVREDAHPLTQVALGCLSCSRSSVPPERQDGGAARDELFCPSTEQWAPPGSVRPKQLSGRVSTY